MYTTLSAYQLTSLGVVIYGDVCHCIDISKARRFRPSRVGLGRGTHSGNWRSSRAPRCACPYTLKRTLQGRVARPFTVLRPDWLPHHDLKQSNGPYINLFYKRQSTEPSDAFLLACVRASCIHRTFSLTLPPYRVAWYVSSERHGRRVGEYQILLAKLTGRPLARKPEGFVRSSIKTSTCSSRGSAEMLTLFTK